MSDTIESQSIPSKSTNTEIESRNNFVNNKQLNVSENEIGKKLKNLPKLCETLENIIKKSQDKLQKVYTDPYLSTLRSRLKNDVNELICLQRGIKSILDEVKSMNLQIISVEKNIKRHKDALKKLKSEEQKRKLVLADTLEKEYWTTTINSSSSLSKKTFVSISDETTFGGRTKNRSQDPFPFIDTEMILLENIEDPFTEGVTLYLEPVNSPVEIQQF